MGSSQPPVTPVPRDALPSSVLWRYYTLIELLHTKRPKTLKHKIKINETLIKENYIDYPFKIPAKLLMVQL